MRQACRREGFFEEKHQVNKLSKIAVLSIALVAFASPALGQEKPAVEAAVEAPGPGPFYISLGVALGTAMIVASAAYGIAKIGSSAVESMARQPEVAGNIQTAMLIAGALIEGLTFFGLVVCLIKVLQKYMG
jgi:F-type H+-transporting ATPase subunit c